MKKLIFILTVIFIFSCQTEYIPIKDEAILKQVIENPDISNQEIYELLAPVINSQIDSNLQYFACSKEDLSVMLGAMIILESGGLKSALTFQNNILGIKCLKARPCVPIYTKEYINGKMELVASNFSAFYSFEDCIHNWFTIIRTTKKGGELRYKEFMQSKDLAELCINISACGYATDPAYTQKVYKLAKSLTYKN